MSQRLYETIKDAGIPVAYLIDTDIQNIQVVYAEEVSDDIKTQVQQIIKDFDWSNEAEQTWLLGKKKDEAIDKINSDIPEIILYRNSLRYVAQGFNILVGKINEIVTAHNLKTNDSIEVLPQVSSWEDLIRFVQILIRQE